VRHRLTTSNLQRSNFLRKRTENRRRCPRLSGSIREALMPNLSRAEQAARSSVLRTCVNSHRFETCLGNYTDALSPEVIVAYSPAPPARNSSCAPAGPDHKETSKAYLSPRHLRGIRPANPPAGAPYAWHFHVPGNIRRPALLDEDSAPDATEARYRCLARPRRGSRRSTARPSRQPRPARPDQTDRQIGQPDRNRSGIQIRSAIPDQAPVNA